MAAPYAALQVPNKELADMGIKEIYWLCRVYFPQIIAEAEKKMNHRD